MNHFRSFFSAIIIIAGLLFADDGTFNALMYYQLSGGNGDITKFDAGRVYLTYQKKVSETLTYKFQTDINPSVSPKEVYLKNAKVDWVTPLGKMVIGLQGMNMFNIHEHNWGHRAVEKSTMDLYGFSSSADMGLGFCPKTNDQLSISVLITNGTGYKNQETDSNKKISLQGVYGERNLLKSNGFNTGLSLSLEPYESSLGKKENRIVSSLFGGISTMKFRAGVEYDILDDSGISGSKTVVSGYGNSTIMQGLNAFIRADHFDQAGTTEFYGIAGFSYAPEKGLSIIPNIRYTKLDNEDGIYNYFLTFEVKI